MGEEGGQRSLTSSDYAQARLSSSGTSGQGHNYAPFLKKSSRFGGSGDCAPPIGTYNLPSCFERRKSPFEDRLSHFLLDSLRAGQQTGVFKSALTRFHQPPSASPGPASYNLFAQKHHARPQKENLRPQKEDASSPPPYVPRTCPSIPHKRNNYGYAVVDGEMKRIEKSEEQLEQERASRKQYADTLAGENRLFRESLHRDFHLADPRRRLFQETSKFLERGSEGQGRSESALLKRPRHHHLYASKPAPLSNEHQLLGPGQYEIGGKLAAPARKEKFQFFGSTEVRFKERGSAEKGYSLLEMIKEDRAEAVHRERKSPFKKRMASSRSHHPLPSSPGPAEYDPQLQCSKQARRAAFFPLEQRFKEQGEQGEQGGQGGQEEQGEGAALQEFGRSRSKKSHNANSLKKERFKPMHQDYQPVRSEQICGIVSESNEGAKPSPKRALGKLLKMNSKRGTEGEMEINSWSREEGRKKGGYMRELKDELAFISYSPLPEEASKQHTKKFERREDE